VLGQVMQQQVVLVQEKVMEQRFLVLVFPFSL
jgi:hypothetical protein